MSTTKVPLSHLVPKVDNDGETGDVMHVTVDGLTVEASGSYTVGSPVALQAAALNSVANTAAAHTLIPTAGMSLVRVSVANAGSWNGTGVFMGVSSADGVVRAIDALQAATGAWGTGWTFGSSSVSGVSQISDYVLAVSGYTDIYLYLSGASQGTITAWGVSSTAPFSGLTPVMNIGKGAGEDLTNNLQMVAGNIADATADTVGSPVKTGTHVTTNANWPGAAYTNANRADAKSDDWGRQRTAAVTNSNRSPGQTIHRNAITAVDKILAPVALTALSDVTSGGALVFNTTYGISVIARNRWGVTTIAGGAVQTQATSNNASSTHCVQFTLASVTGADSYDIFVSASATGPLWVASITEAQRANANGTLVTAVGTVSNGSSLGSGVIQVQVVGTGQAANATNFAQNNAYTPASVTAIAAAGWAVMTIHVRLTLTDWRSAPSLALVPFFADQTATTDFFAGQKITLQFGTATGQPLSAEIKLPLDGATGVAWLIDAIGGQGAAASIWYELS